MQRRGIDQGQLTDATVDLAGLHPGSGLCQKKLEVESFPLAVPLSHLDFPEICAAVEEEQCSCAA